MNGDLSLERKSQHIAQIPHEQRDAPGKNRTCARGLGNAREQGEKSLVSRVFFGARDAARQLARQLLVSVPPGA
jgi:hypothetical protein